ncbi:OmpA family protein [Dyadobacter pollutisoli]|uniref:OmpA family protein n=1 Tax=Dyadobacter pollutisoli TaxID=2910158 RepID=A0A9E8NFE2_9BACT|nr:OmpA family protein [Dyadobacter pollutisoli]WAC14948.1 OmpA family protein [Dyadobacter pollutisoli]
MNKTQIFLALCLVAGPANAQIIDPKRTAERKATDRANNRIDQSIDKGFDKVEEGIGSLFKKKNKKEKQGQEEVSESKEDTPKQTDSGAGKETAASKTAASALSYYSKFDFVPGEKVIAAEDFSNTNIGDFPVGWNTNSSAEVITLGDSPVKWLFMSKDGFFQPEFIKDMPENFTIEFDVFTRYRSSNILEYQFQIASSASPKKDLSEEYTSNYFQFKWLASNTSTSFYVVENGEVVNKNEGFSVKDFASEDVEHLEPVRVRISIWRQKSRLRIYANQNKIVDIPQAFDSKLKYNVFKFGGKYLNFSENENRDEFMVSDIRYAIGSADTRSKLITAGKLITRGILFNTNSDVIQPSSYGVLKDIAGVLAENPTVKIKIVGHTDSDGENQANLILSQKRAAAVKSMLSGEFKIDPSRMLTDGKGENEPSDSNDTPTGKANNRRVEFTKL